MQEFLFLNKSCKNRQEEQAQAGGSWAATTTTMAVRCLWGQFCAIFFEISVFDLKNGVRF